MKENSIKLTLPLPPSANELFTGYPKRVKSDVYKNWLLRAGSIIKGKTYKISGTEWLEAKIIVFMPLYFKNGNKKIQDLDNLIKPTLDSLAHSEKKKGPQNIPGFKDHLIKKILATKVDSDRKEIEIEIKEINN